MVNKRKNGAESAVPSKRSRQLDPGERNAARRKGGGPGGQPSAFAVSTDDGDGDEPGFMSTREAMAYLRTVRYEPFARPARNPLDRQLMGK